LEPKICPKYFRPKRRLIKSAPGEAARVDVVDGAVDARAGELHTILKNKPKN
jgi:hypothetical protein